MCNRESLAVSVTIAKSMTRSTMSNGEKIHSRKTVQQVVTNGVIIEELCVIVLPM